VRLQRYADGGLSDVTTFKAEDGLSWLDGAGRTQTMSMKELKDWRGKRADAGRIAQGLPKNNKFRGAPTAAKSDDE
jgi:topoisomerase-4 subunit A